MLLTEDVVNDSENVTDTHTDDCLTKNDQISFEIWFEPKVWSNTNEHNRIQPAGNEASANQNGYPLGGPGLLEDNDDVRAEESKTYTNEGIFPEARIKDDASADHNSYTLRNTDSLEHNNVVRTEEQEKCKGDNINKDTSTETMILDKLDTQAMIEANNKRGNTMNNFRNQRRNDLHINGNSINAIPFIRPPGSVVYRERLVSYN